MAARFFTRRTRKKALSAEQAKGPTPKHRFEGHKEAIWNFLFLHDNVHIVSCSVDGTMRKWNCDTGLAVGEPWEGKGGSIYALALSPDGKIMACGRNDGSVQRWNTDGEMIGGIWVDYSYQRVQTLSWSPIGDHLASGSHDGIILIRNAESGKLEVDPILTDQDKLYTVSFSPSGDRIASGGSSSGDRLMTSGAGSNDTICIWNSKTGELLLDPIKDLGNTVTSVVWSSDGTKLYSASDFFARVFDSTSGALLHRYEHDHSLFSIVLSPKNNVLACVGYEGVARLWDTESHHPLGLPFPQYHESLHCVSFSRDGRYLAYGGSDKKITLWMNNDIAPGLAVSMILPQQGHGQLEATQQPDKTRPGAQQESHPQSTSSSFLDADATGGDGILEDAHDPYNNFFQSSQSPLPAAMSGPLQPPNLSSARQFWNTISRHRLPPIPLRGRKFFAPRARANSSMEPATTKPNQPTPDGSVRAGKVEESEHDDDDDDRGSANLPLGVRKDKGKQQDEIPADVQSPPLDDPPAKLDNQDNRNLWKRLTRTHGKNPVPVQIAPAMKPPKVVEVSAVRGFQGYVALKRKRKTKSQAMTFSALVAPHASGSSRVGLSSQMVSVQGSTSSHPVSGQPKLLSQTIVGNGAQYLQATGGPSSHTPPSRFATTYSTNHDSDSRSTIEGSFNRFLDRICFPCGHFHKDSSRENVD